MSRFLKTFYAVCFLVIVAAFLIFNSNKKGSSQLFSDNSADSIGIALLHDSSGLFDPLPQPGPGDWLSVQQEPGQTLKQFLDSKRNIPDSTRKYLYLQPIWVSDDTHAPKLKAFAEAYFQMPVKVGPVLHPSKSRFERRINPGTQKEQVHAGLVLDYLKKRIPDDAFCVQAFTEVDLYPEPDWNFVFGYASYYERAGIFSIARFDPSFYRSRQTEDREKRLLMRSCKILAHETGHMFSMPHCIFYHCCMNGSNNLAESDAQPVHLCPVCHEKLRSTVRFDPIRRYRMLGDFYEAEQVAEQSGWIKAITND